MVIYCIKNTVNDKCYIGKTIKTFQRRKQKHLYHLNKGNHHNTYLQNSWNKYGEENFKWVILEREFDSGKELNEAEIFWIQYLRTFLYEYNLTIGGDGTLGRVDSEETKRKRGEAIRKYCPIGVYGLGGALISTHTSKVEVANEYGILSGNIYRLLEKDCTYNQVRLRKINPENPKPYIGKHRPPNLSYAAKYNKKGKLLEVYKSITIAGLLNDCSYSWLVSACHRPKASCGGFMWRSSKTKDFPEQIEPYGNYKERIGNPNKKRVIQYDFDGNFIKVFGSMKDAMKEINHKKSNSINLCCEGKRNHAGGYQWRWHEEKFPKKIDEFASHESQFKPVNKLDTKGNILDTYESVKSAAKDVGLKNPSSISAVLKERNKTSMGYDWEYAD